MTRPSPRRIRSRGTTLPALPEPKADIYVTTQNGAYNGTRIASNISVAGGTNTFNWTGTDERGVPMPNGTYYVYVVQRTTVGVGVGYASGPLRLEKPVPPTPSYYVPLNPARLLDTRTGEGGNLSPLGNGVFTELDVTGVGGVPETGVTAVVMNVTVTGPTASGFITAWPSGEPKPFVSNLNFVPGQEVPNLVTVKIGANGRVNLFNSAGDSNVIADVVGYYTPNAPPSGGRFTAVTPARLLDTRDGTGGFVGALSQLQSIDLKVTGVGGVPASGVTGVALNVTVDQPTGTGYLTVWPTGEPRPNASTHNFVPGLTVANMVLGKVGAGGKVSIYNSAGNTHVVADVIGYFSSSGGAFVPVTPQRLVDTREGIGGAGHDGQRGHAHDAGRQRQSGAGRRQGGHRQRHVGQQLGAIVHHRVADGCSTAVGVDAEPASWLRCSEPGVPAGGQRWRARRVQRARIDRPRRRRVRLRDVRSLEPDQPVGVTTS